MRALRLAHGALAVAAGLALVAAVVGSDRLAISVLVLLILILAASNETLRAAIRRLENRP